MALTILFVIHLLAIGIKYIQSVPYHTITKPNEATESNILYQYIDDDNIVVLHSDNFDKYIYNSTEAWTVLFYNSQNGQWMTSYFTWKYLAETIHNWRNIVKTASIDCAGTHNMKLCQKYKISEYPTFRYFPPQLKSFDIGDTISTNITATSNKLKTTYLNDMEILRVAIVKCLENTETKMSNWPGFTPINAVNFDSALSISNDSVLVLIVESEQSYLGRQLMMDLHGVENVIVRYSFERWIADKNRDLPQAFALLPRGNIKFVGSTGLSINPISMITDAGRYLVFKVVQYDLKKLGFNVPDLITDSLEPRLTDSEMEIFMSGRTKKNMGTFLDSAKFTQYQPKK